MSNLSIVSAKDILTMQSKVLAKLKLVSKKQDKIKLLYDLDAAALLHGKLSKFARIASGQVFSYFKENWEALPKEFTQAYGGGFYQYVLERHGIGEQMADMYVKVWKTFYSGDYKIPKMINANDLPMPKLNAIVPYVAGGKMDKRRWKIVARASTMSGKHLREKLAMSDKATGSTRVVKRMESPGAGHVSSVQLVNETGDLRVFVGGQYEQVGFLNLSSTNPAVIQLIEDIVKASKIRRVA